MADNGVPKRLAVLIDADDASARWAHTIFDENLELQNRPRRRCRHHGLHDRKLRATRWLHQD